MLLRETSSTLEEAREELEKIARLREALDRVAALTVDDFARAMYEAAPWTGPEFTGKPRRAWRIEGVPWDTDSDVQLCEHERDDYRLLANAAIGVWKRALGIDSVADGTE